MAASFRPTVGPIAFISRAIVHLAPDLSDAIYTVIFIVHALYLRFQQVVTLFPLAAPVWRAMLLMMLVICRRGGIQLMACRSDPVFIAQGIHQGHFFPQAVELCLRKISEDDLVRVIRHGRTNFSKIHDKNPSNRLKKL